MNLMGVDLGISKIALAVFTENGLPGTTLADARAVLSVAPTRDQCLWELASVAREIATYYGIDWCFIEEPLLGNNRKYSMELSQTCGAVLSELSTLRGQGMDVRMVNVKTWKKQVIGNGNASKADVRDYIHVTHPAYAAVCDGDQDRYDATCVGIYGLTILDRARQLTLTSVDGQDA